ncbi:BON domain-containing protein [Burkholderia guangdongensis]|uniref:BON domain-containing protein n=1 Tax=Burkholderia guangdongensis TaxID=1792500 RepID=UPI0015CE27C8|nr:BON domain-containing protein [Burkholderia guangdongensis]
MKKMKALGVALAVAIATATATGGAWAQASASAVASVGASAGVATAAPGATSKKAIRQANRALKRKVYAALAKHKEIDAGSISIIAKGGAVTLNGTVTDASQIDTVASVAKGVAGVSSVTNKLTVQRPLGQ